ncbi:MarR family winged helix-turn-helix transcriptional regulator [Pararhodobacter oceanensis]|uniref:MarR family transcriptional regulator n=1 Tax=Pararhodobacter oceanensis TaxID=2172121 RepID=A0A2T8HSK9_9RHOB|nr:MarR family transcriptional regulator [Pararhodobacter oceanensis]
MKTSDDLAVSLFAELFMADQLARARVVKHLPKGLELSQFSVLNHLARTTEDRTPAQLAKAFHVTRGAMTNTLRKLEVAGHVHIRPDWDDARRKFVTISPAGLRAREDAIRAISPVISGLAEKLGTARIRTVLPLLRDLRSELEQPDEPTPSRK